MAKTHGNFQGVMKGFDEYNKNNLLLKTCNAEDIQYIQNNPLVYQEDVRIFSKHPHTTKTVSPTPSRSPPKSKTTKDFYHPSAPSSTETEKKSKEA
jgi:hypothetical protein